MIRDRRSGRGRGGTTRTCSTSSSSDNNHPIDDSRVLVSRATSYGHSDSDRNLHQQQHSSDRKNLLQSSSPIIYATTVTNNVVDSYGNDTNDFMNDDDDDDNNNNHHDITKRKRYFNARNIKNTTTLLRIQNKIQHFIRILITCYRTPRSQQHYKLTRIVVVIGCLFFVFVILCTGGTYWKRNMKTNHEHVWKPRETNYDVLGPFGISYYQRSLQHLSEYDVTLNVSSFSPGMSPMGTIHIPDSLNKKEIKNAFKKDYGGLSIRFIDTNFLKPIEYNQQKTPSRLIYRDYQMDLDYTDLVVHEHDDDYVESYYAFDDDYRRNPYRHNDDDKVPLKKQCRRTKWHRNLYINCNNLHEFDVEHRFLKGESKFVNAGSYREVYVTNLPSETVVFKAYYWGAEFNREDFEYMRMDAIVSERLSQHTEIVSLYAYCGTGMINEAMSNGDLYQHAAPYGHHGMNSTTTLNDTKDQQSTPQQVPPLVVSNNLTGTEKLRFAYEMAVAVSLLHSYPGGVIVHQDVKPAQYLLTNDKQHVKFNDFNRAEILLWDDINQEYCPFVSGKGHGVWRAPEEYQALELTEQIDVWSLGASMYVLLTGLKPHHEIMDRSKILYKKTARGDHPYLDPRYAERSYGDKKLLDIIPLCWVYDPTKRITVFELVKLLQQAVQEYEEYGSIS